MKTLIAAFMALLFMGGPSPAPADLRQLPLKHTQADEVLPLLRPLAGRAALSGEGDQVLVRGSAAEIHEVERALAILDQPKRSFVLSVREVWVRDDAGPRVTVRALSPETGAPSDSSPPRPDKVSVRTAEREVATRSIRIQEGGRGYIALGDSEFPLRRAFAWTSAGGRPGPRLDPIAEIEPLARGFDVVPRAQGDAVRLRITPRLKSPFEPSSEATHPEAPAVTAMIRQGEWLDLGRLVGPVPGDSFIGGRETRADERRTILIRLEP